RQVVITVKMIVASPTGTQPPDAIFTRLAARNEASKRRNRATSDPAAARDQRQRSRATTKNSSEVIVIVPATAMPYAFAIADDLRKPSTRAMQATIRIRLTCG